MRAVILTSMLLLTASTASAQSVPSQKKLILLGGATRANVSGDDVADGVEPRMGFVAGIGVSLPISRVLTIQPEVTVVQKGSRLVEPGGEVKLRVTFVELPVQLRWNIPTAGGIRPWLSGGAALAVRAGCSVSGDDGTGDAVSISCERLTELDDPGIEWRKTDLGFVAGGGVAFDLGGQALNVGARYTRGTRSLINQAESTHRVLSLVVGLEFPLLQR